MSSLLNSLKGKKRKSGFPSEKPEADIGKVLLFGALAGFAVTVIFICIFAVIMLLANIDRMYASLFATLSVSAGSFVSAFFVAKRTKLKGIISGLLTGICYFVVIAIISLAVDGAGFTSNTLFHLIIILLSSAIGGIIGANKKQSAGRIRL